MVKEELMIGDWVKVPCLVDTVEGDNGCCQVRQLRDCDLDVVGFKELDYNEIIPIPLTPEILEKNGFKLKEKGILYTEYVSGDEHSIIEFGFYKESIHDIETVLNCELGFVGGLDRIHHCHVKYVHELQHALRLCGINKTIEL